MENELLVNVVTDWLNDTNKVKLDELETFEVEQLLNEAIDHQLQCLVFDKLCSRTLLDNHNDIVVKHKYTSYMIMLDCKSKINNSLSLFSALNDSDIKYVMLKGLIFRGLYDNHNVRLLNDFDIYVAPNQLKEATEILISEGYKKNDLLEHSCNLYFEHPEKIPVELHHRLFPKDTFGNIQVIEKIIFNNTTSIEYHGTSICVPEISTSYVYSLLHLAKHLAVTGFGYRQLVDLVVFYEEFKADDKVLSNVSSLLRHYQLEHFASYLHELCNRFFERDLPLYVSSIEERRLSYLHKHIHNSGVFGHKTLENDIESEYLSEMQNGDGNLKNPIRKKISLLFPKSNKMRGKYSYVNDNKILLPIGWVHRLLNNLINPNQHAIRYLKETPNLDNLYERFEMLDYFNLAKRNQAK